jgi:hypothetical protein
VFGVLRIFFPDRALNASLAQLKGYIVRWATYSKGGFKEGVSLTIEDELNRWQKYSYGCSEIIFNPLISWWRLGPITKQLRDFTWSPSPLHYKIGMMSYVFSYCAHRSRFALFTTHSDFPFESSPDGIAASAFLTLLNYVILGFGLDVDGAYLASFEIWLSCTAVFGVTGNLGFIILEYRLGHRGLFSSFMETLQWIPFLCVLHTTGFHVSRALT